MNQLFDRTLIIKSKNKALKNWKEHNYLYNLVANILFEKINELKENFNNILFLSSDCFELLGAHRFKFKKMILVSEYIDLLKTVKDSEKRMGKINANFENLSLEKNKFDLVIVNLCLHKINNVESFCSNLFSTLEPKGLLICSYFGGKSLIELRNSLLLADDKLKQKSYQRIIPFIDMLDATSIFQKIGFKEIVSDNTKMKIKYSSLGKLLNDIKGMGENNCLKDGYKGLLSRNFLRETEKIYKTNFSNKLGELFVTCEIITLVMWKY